MDMSGPVAIFLFFLLLLVDMFFYGFDAAIDNLNEKEILHKAEEEKDRRSMRLSATPQPSRSRFSPYKYGYP